VVKIPDTALIAMNEPKRATLAVHDESATRRFVTTMLWFDTVVLPLARPASLGYEQGRIAVRAN
jgi:hypothetical protein